MGKVLKARIVGSNKLVKVNQFDKVHFEDKKTGVIYHEKDLNFLPPTHMVQFGFHIWRFGFYLFAREYWRHKLWYIVPGVAVSSVNGYDRYVDAEVKILFIGLGIRFIWVKKK